MTILLTGTHLTPALATIQALRRKTADARLVYVGRKHTGAAESVEKEEIERAGAEFKTMTFGKLHRHFTWRQTLEWVKLPVGFWQAGKLVSELKPDAVVSFGGYLAVPLVIWGKLHKAKVVIHEQTTRWGLANRLVRWMADKTAVGLREMAEPGVVWTGNPIREEVLALGSESSLTSSSPGLSSSMVSKMSPSIHLPILYITGGNQGSKTIDKVIEKILPDLVEKFEVFHQTKSVFSLKHPRYHASPWFSTPIHAEILSRVAVSVSRAGANTVAELMYLGIPSILVPLPDSAGGEQQKNAEMIAGTGLGKIIKQEDLSAEGLLGAIGAHMESEERRAKSKGLGRLLVKGDAADKLAELILGEKE